MSSLEGGLKQRSLWRSFFLYAAVTTPLAFVNLPLAIALPSFYAGNTAATLAGIGAVMFFVRLFDAVIDPLIGYLSDRTDTRLGSRKPWVIAGAILAPVALYFLFNPSPTSGVAYFAGWSLAFYFGLSCLDIPYRAWGVEIVHEGHGRAKLSSMVTSLTVVGSLIFWVMPLILSPMTGTTAITGQTFTGISWLFLIILPLLVLLAVIFIPNGRRLSTEKPNFVGMFTDVFRNKPALYFYAAYGLWLVGNGVFLAVFFIFISEYMRLEDKFSYIMILYFLVQMAAMPVWLRLVYRFGKRRCWAFSWIAYPFINLSMLFLEPGTSAFVPMMALVVVAGAVAAGALLMPMAVIGDVVDYGTWKSGANRSANYFAFNNLLAQIGMGAGFGIAFPLLAAFGYEWGDPLEGSARLGLIICYLVIPGVLSILAGLMVLRFPLHSARHKIVLKALDRRLARANRASGADQ